MAGNWQSAGLMRPYSGPKPPTRPQGLPRGAAAVYTDFGRVGVAYNTPTWPRAAAADHGGWPSLGPNRVRFGRLTPARPSKTPHGRGMAQGGPRAGELRGGWGAPPCASHRPISTRTPECPFPAPSWAAPEPAQEPAPGNAPSRPWSVYGQVGAAPLREPPSLISAEISGAAPTSPQTDQGRLGAFPGAGS